VCNPQDYPPLFGPSLNWSKIASGKQTIPQHYGMIYRQLPDIEKSQPIAPKYEIKPGAQHQTLRGRKHIYKIMLASYSGQNKPYFEYV
jgi:DNA-directed RNA polymerase subunit H (RpoH/RPB5)